MPEPISPEAQRAGASLERPREEVLAAAQDLPPFDDMVIDDLTEDESRRFMEIVLAL